MSFGPAFTSGKVVNYTAFYSTALAQLQNPFSWKYKLIFIASWEYLAFLNALVWTLLFENLVSTFG
jgi:hypothetical protein